MKNRVLLLTILVAVIVFLLAFIGVKIHNESDSHGSWAAPENSFFLRITKKIDKSNRNLI